MVLVSIVSILLSFSPPLIVGVNWVLPSEMRVKVKWDRKLSLGILNFLFLSTNNPPYILHQVMSLILSMYYMIWSLGIRDLHRL